MAIMRNEGEARDEGETTETSQLVTPTTTNVAEGDAAFSAPPHTPSGGSGAGRKAQTPSRLAGAMALAGMAVAAGLVGYRHQEGVGADRSAAALDARTSKAGTSSSLTDTSEWLYLLNNATDLSDSDVYCDKSYDLEYAQCYTGFCTKNGDGKTASCGCLSMRPSDDNEPKLELGWPSAVLIESGKYRNAVEDYVNGDASVGEGLMCTALADGSVWEEYGFDSTPDRVSMYSSDNPYFSTSGEVEECDSDFDFAQCMGAPCWDTSYDSIWNVTCICPYKTESSGSVFESRSGICDDAKPSTDCAAVGFGSTELTYTLTELEELIDAVEDADTTISTSECPCERVDDDYRR
mmetsp:Transcript_81353/g.230916  ORF Transcript_81353/g.230916 Transcript_81353/m.230916 type:complete len:350 (-) Transcript_81353:210-1259(-)